jgi:hypothetical protein
MAGLTPVQRLAALVLLSTLTTAQKDNAAECSCFVTNGTSSSYYLNHRFWDFRHVSSSLVSPSTPLVLQAASDTTNADSTSAFFSQTSFANDWAAQTWDNSDTLGTDSSDASILMLNSRNNVYITPAVSTGTNSKSENYTTLLTLRSARTAEFQSAGEIDSTEQNFKHLSVRYLARVSGSSGACAGLFTYRCPGVCQSTSSTIVEEADIEILTQGPDNAIQYTNQPSETPDGNAIAAATRNVTIDGSWTDWNVYRYDWTDGMSTWYVNGTQTANISVQAPKNPAQLILNMWGDGGSWTGNMSVGEEAYLQVQWIEVFFNTSGNFNSTNKSARDVSSNLVENAEEGLRLEKRGGGCKVVCGVDQNATAVAGTPVVLSSGAGGQEIWSMAGILVASLVGVLVLY